MLNINNHLFSTIIIIFLYINKCQDLFESTYRIDSVFNGLCLSVQDNEIISKNTANGLSENFYITSSYEDSYFIISRQENKRLGVDVLNNLKFYNLDDNKDIKKTYWKFINYNNNQNVYLIQNVFSQKFLEINQEDNKLICKNIVIYNPLNNLNQVKKNSLFIFLKLFENLQIRPIDIEKLKNEPIDVFMKYTDYTDKTLNRKGINEKIKEKDMEELKYSIRSIFKYIPWIRKIFIVMPNDKVRFFKNIEAIRDKIVYIKEKDIIGFDTANSAPLQFNLYKLEKYGISQNFIYMDDNYFIGGNLKKTDLFYYDDKSKKVVPAIVNYFYYELNRKEINRNYDELFNKKDKLSPYDFPGWRITMLASEKLILDNYNISIIGSDFTHNAIPLNINDLKEIYDLIISKYKFANDTLNSLDKNVLNLQPQHLFCLYGLNIKKREVHPISYNLLQLEDLKTEYLYTKFFGLLTGGEYSEKHEAAKMVLQSRYPEPIKYEIEYVEKKDEIKEEKDSTYIDKKELRHMEEVFKNELYNYILIYWGLIILNLIIFSAIIYYFYDMSKTFDLCKRNTYDKISQYEN